MYSTHKQVPFETMIGNVVGVDEGMLDILNELKRLGVKTRFSCQGGGEYDSDRAYVLGTGRTFLPLILKIIRKRIRRKLGPRSRYMCAGFRYGYRGIEISRFRGLGTQKKPARMTFQSKTGLGDHELADFRITLMYSNLYGFRIVVRWPMIVTSDILGLLREI